MELRKRLRHRNMRQNQNEETEVKDMEVNEYALIIPFPCLQKCLIIPVMEWKWMKFIHAGKVLAEGLEKQLGQLRKDIKSLISLVGET